jgi:hypothetical protein
VVAGRVPLASLASGVIADTIAIDDGAAVLFADTAVERVVSWREGRTAYRVSRANGRAEEVAFPTERLA